MEFTFGEVDIRRPFDNLWQWLQFPDPLLKSARPSGIVSTFLLLARFCKNSFIANALAYGNFSIGSRDENLKVALFWVIFTFVLIISFVEFVVAQAKLLVITLLLIRGIIPPCGVCFDSTGAFPKEPADLWTQC